MGVASGDYNGDGRLDLFVTNSRREPYAVFRHGTGAGAPTFRDGRSALRSAYAGSAGWGASWVDLALNGRPDLVLANGDVPITNLAKDAAPIRVLSDLSANGNSKRFANVGVAGLRGTPTVNGRGLAAADYDNNGTVDIAVGSIGGPLVLLRNTGDAGHWLEVELVGRRSNRPGLGAWVEATAGGRRQVRFHTGGSLYSQSLLPEHFGLGAATEARVTVAWPSGIVQSVDTPADRRLKVVEAER